MNKIIFSLFIIQILLLQFSQTKIDIEFDDDDDDPFQTKRLFTNPIEDQREYNSILDKRRHLARTKFEEHCEPKGKILERICPPLEQCLLTTGNQIKQRSLRRLLEKKENAYQFLHNYSRKKRFLFYNSNNNNYQEKHVYERRHKGILLYEHYCESTDRLPRSCPQIDRCQCNDCTID